MNNSPVFIITPCYNENNTIIKLLHELDTILPTINEQFNLIVVDDASTDNTLNLLSAFSFTAQNITFKIITVEYNVGHQGAIFQGLLYAGSLNAKHAIVMDSDGEDDPNAIQELVTRKHTDLTYVVRGKRKEKMLFKVFYKCYQLLFFLITNKRMNFGNFCMLSERMIKVATHSSFIHFAAFLSKQKTIPDKIVYDRRSRLDGKSKMSYNGLLQHAFKSFIEYAEDLLMFFLKLFIVLMLVSFGLIAYILYEKLFTNRAILGWASTLSASLFTIAIMCLGFFVIGLLLLNLVNKKPSDRYTDLYKIIK
jgi:glycosyltransferase involved in cell wall biosynthesis